VKPRQHAVSGLPNAAFWRGRRVLVTGHTGFVGGWTCAWLHSLGCDVSGFALAPSSNPSFCDLAGIAGRIRGVIADIRSQPDLAEVCSNERPQIVLHLAAQPIVREAHERPVETFDVNVMGTVHVLEQARLRSPDAVVVFTSDKVYAKREGEYSHTESDRLGPAESYGGSKACCELAIEAYAGAYLAPAGIGVASVRAGNVIGGGDWGSGRLVPDAIRAFSAGEPLRIRRPEGVRPWQHVLDAVNGLLLVAERSAQQRGHIGAWNIAPPPGPSPSVRSLAQLVADAWQDGAEVRIEPSAGFPEAPYLAVDSSRARRELSLRSPWTIDRTVAETVAWYRAAQAGADMWDFTQAQIAAYGLDRSQAETAQASG